jgi:uncharacterized membrane protein YuzA (DUF378 family)
MLAGDFCWLGGEGNLFFLLEEVAFIFGVAVFPVFFGNGFVACALNLFQRCHFIECQIVGHINAALDIGFFEQDLNLVPGESAIIRHIIYPLRGNSFVWFTRNQTGGFPYLSEEEEKSANPDEGLALVY